jgi:hypothetical protein
MDGKKPPRRSIRLHHRGVRDAPVSCADTGLSSNWVERAPAKKDPLRRFKERRSGLRYG